MIKSCLILSLAAVLFTGCASFQGVQGVATADSKPAAASLVPYDLPHYKRVNLLVADLERSLKVYQDILGFSAGTISESSVNSFSYPVFNIPREARMRYTYLGEPGESRVFGLTEVTNIDLPRPQNSPHLTASVIGVTDLADKIVQIKALGLDVTDSKTSDGAEFRFLEQAFVDYDGHLIVLYEVLGE